MRTTDFSPHLSKLLKAKVSTFFLLSPVFSFNSCPVPQRHWPTLIQKWHQHKHSKNIHAPRWTSTPRCYTPSAWEMDVPAVYSCSGIAIVFSSTSHLLDSFSVWMMHITECDGAKHQTCTTQSTQHQLPTTRPAREMHESYGSIRREGKNNLIHKLAKVN